MKKISHPLILTGKIFLTASFAVFLLWAIQKDYQKAQAKTLNYFRPASLEYLLAVDPNNVNKSRLIEYVIYYRKILRHIPVHSEAHEVLGFCYYHLGKYQQAIAAYRKSTELHPGFFWPHYNLGVIYFKMGKYPEAAEAFERALADNPVVAFHLLSASRIYKGILPEMNSKDMLETYRALPTLIVLSNYASGQLDDKTYKKISKQADLLQVKIY